MRKLLAIIIICFSLVLFKNEKASSKGNCRLCCNKLAKAASLSAKADHHSDDDPRQFDGFFFKI
jgi:hypothetical protein